MIEAVAEIGKFLIEKKSKASGKSCADDQSNNLSSFLTPVESEKVILICLKQKQTEFEYCGLDLQNPLVSRAQLYLFSQGAKGGGTNYSPVCILTKPKTPKTMTEEQVKQATKEQVEKVFKQKVENWFLNKALPLAKKFSKQGDISKEDAYFIQCISQAVSENREKIIEDISELLFEVEFEKQKSSALLTFSIDGKYIGEYEIFKSFLLELIKEKAERSSSQDKTCSICKQKRENVSGTVNVFKFYTIDKPGFIRGGFSSENAWKNFPVCSSCQIHLSEGRKYLEKELQFKFYNFKYLLIPQLIFSTSSAYSEVLDILQNTKKEISLGEKALERITDDENEILDVISTFNDSISVTFLFMVPQMGAERIVLMIEDVLPSHLKNIFDAKRHTERKYRTVFNNPDINFTFQQIKHFFSKSNRLKKKSDLDSYFLEITESIFKKKPIDFQFLAAHFCRRLQDSIANKDFFDFYTSCSYAIEVLEFLNKLEILKLKGDEFGMSYETPFDEILNEFPVASANPAVKGIILVGALCDILMRIQSTALSKTPGKMPPFAKNLKGLRLKQSDIVSLLPKIENKLMEYSSFGKANRLIASSASELLLKSPVDWKLSADEVSFYFACGMNLGQKIREHAKKLTGDTDEQEA
ncbi:CRISPR-associated protein, Csh1 family [Caldicellulosiruptor acetigenus I77R1B]|uniref:CRISPR-associated protein Csh1 domain protein n=2 Tax=Caldicellulosiruptor acetigenus TaxID=301953 RepID=G2PYQ0_9FIRM|nr:TIGR02556 family CRISPR-associated protein [Caldicellulosiruptor acetigenus]ADQ42004.1 CRISPR-associated protein, Csh1 family [Caldicellulosiruptor acetigenus I77R1B]AEM74969.1 CRISPR-associated protein Csh1 domain protein [Caldicellulosiruptor acetigenus 6A]